MLVEMRYVDIEPGRLVDTYARSAFEDTRRKAAKYGAMGSTIRATKPAGAAQTPTAPPISRPTT
jgi:hypothetical protein